MPSNFHCGARLVLRPLPLALTLALGCATFAPAARAAEPAPNAAAPTPATPITLDRIEVTAAPATDLDTRRYSTAAKTIISRDEVMQFGDSNVSEVLKRLPGISIGGRPGRGGDVRMRGLGNGYTQVLINGERIPPGFSVESLAPEQIERIEIMKAPTAEYGTRAIAGTINIVLREALQKRSNEVKFESLVEHGRVSPRASLTRNDALDDHGGAYNFSLSVFRNNQLDEQTTFTRNVSLADGALLQARAEPSRTTSDRDGLHLSSRLQWKLDGGDTLGLTPFLIASQGSSHGDSTLTQSVGATAAPYAASHTDTDSSNAIARLNGQWLHRIDPATRLELNLGLGDAQSHSKSLRTEADASGAPSRTLDTDSDATERSWNLKGKLSRALDAGHNLVGGWEWEQARRQQVRTALDDGQLQLANYGNRVDAGTRLVAGYGQDEWDITPNWSAYAGLRWEAITTDSASGGSQINNRSAVWSPLLHGVWKPDENARDQVRASVTRSYKSPTLAQLSGLPALSIRPNDAVNPDSAGNPALRPELATGIDLAFEHYFGQRGIASVGVFQRHITDLIRTVTRLRDVPWADEQRWVAAPENVGGATARGIELEARATTSEIWPGSAPINLKASASVYRSRVDGIAGPDNRLDQQPKAQGSFSADGRFATLPLTLGASVAWTPATVVQASVDQSNRVGTKIGVDAFGTWAFTRNSNLRIAAGNLAARDYETGTTIVAPSLAQSQTSTTRAITRLTLSARWEWRI